MTKQAHELKYMTKEVHRIAQFKRRFCNRLSIDAPIHKILWVVDNKYDQIQDSLNEVANDK